MNITTNITSITCPLCEIELNNDNIIRLSCNPDKHYFCYNCIEEWFNTIKNNKLHIIEYKKRECPICRESTKFLPLLEGKKYIKHIHSPTNNPIHNKKNNELNNELNDNKYNEVCNHLLKTKNAHCKNIGKKEYGGFCGIHKSTYYQ